MAYSKSAKWLILIIIKIILDEAISYYVYVYILMMVFIWC